MYNKKYSYYTILMFSFLTLVFAIKTAINDDIISAIVGMVDALIVANEIRKLREE